MPSAAPLASPRNAHGQVKNGSSDENSSAPTATQHRPGGPHQDRAQLDAQAEPSSNILSDAVHRINARIDGLQSEEVRRHEELVQMIKKTPGASSQPSRSLRPRTKTGQAVTASSASARQELSSPEASPAAASSDAVRISIVSKLDTSQVSLSITRPGIQGQTPVPTAVLVHALRLSYEHIISSATNSSSSNAGEMLSQTDSSQKQPGCEAGASSLPNDRGVRKGPIGADLERLHALHRHSFDESTTGDVPKAARGSTKTLVRSLSFAELATRARAEAQARAGGTSPNKRPRHDDENKEDGREATPRTSAPGLPAPTVPSERIVRPRSSSVASTNPHEDAALAAALHQKLSQAGFGSMDDTDRQKLLIGTILAQHRVAADRLDAVGTQRDQLLEQLNAERATHAQAAAVWSELRLRLIKELQELRNEHDRVLSELSELRSHVYSQGVDPAATFGSADERPVVDAQTSPTLAGSFETLLSSGNGTRFRADSGGSGSGAHSTSSTSVHGSEGDLAAAAVQAAACAWDYLQNAANAANFSDPRWQFVMPPTPGDVNPTVMAAQQTMPMMGNDMGLRSSVSSGVHVAPLVSSPTSFCAPSNGMPVSSDAATAALATAALQSLHSSSSSSHNAIMPPPSAPSGASS